MQYSSSMHTCTIYIQWNNDNSTIYGKNTDDMALKKLKQSDDIFPSLKQTYAWTGGCLMWRRMTIRHWTWS